MTKLFHKKLLHTSIAAGLTLALNPVALTQAEEGDSVRGLEEIVVTARRREENLQEIPVAVSAFTPELLQAKGISQPYDLIGNVPGLTVQGGSASRNDVLFFIRGQGQTFGSNPSVIQYYNDVPVNPNSTTGGVMGTFYDLDNIQVLKGPQGTLFGRTTTGGAVLVNAKRPGYEFDGFVEVKAGNYSAREYTGAINIPLIDDMLAIRIAGNVSSHNGYSKSYITGQDLDDRNRDSFRVGVLFEPTEWLSNYTLYEHNTVDENGSAVLLEFFNPNHPLLNTTSSNPGTIGQILANDVCPFAPFFGQSAADCVTERIGIIDNLRNANIAELNRIRTGGDDAIRKNAHNQIGYIENETQLITNVTDIELGDLGFLGETTLKNIFSTNRTIDAFTLREIGGSPLPHAYAPSHADFVNFEPTPVKRTDRYGNTDWMDNYSEEIQLAGAVRDMHDWVVGYYFERDKNSIYFNAPSSFYTLGGVFGFPLGLPAVSNGFTDDFLIENKGIFGQTTLDLADFGLEDFKLTLGYRKSEFTQDLTVVDSELGIDGWQKTPGGNSYPGSVEQKEDSYNVALDWQVNDDLLLYVAHRRGFKQGGVNLQSLDLLDVAPDSAKESFDPETVKDFEFGAKMDWVIGDIYGRTNLAIYKSEYNDLHRNETFANGRGGVSTQIANIAAAETKGFEIENTLRLTDNLQLDLSYSYLDAEYTDYPGTALNELGETVQLVDQDYSGAPKNILGVLVQYWMPFFPVRDGNYESLR